MYSGDCNFVVSSSEVPWFRQSDFRGGRNRPSSSPRADPPFGNQLEIEIGRLLYYQPPNHLWVRFRPHYTMHAVMQSNPVWRSIHKNFEIAHMFAAPRSNTAQFPIPQPT
jgi:hypothetical protein